MTVPKGFEIATLRRLARHALPGVVEGGVIPLVVFYAALAVAGVRGAMYASCAWAYLAILRRVIQGGRVSGLLVLTGAAVTTRLVVALALHSTFVYFLQPSLGTAVVGAAFLASLRHRQPLAQRLAADFVPMPQKMLGSPAVRRVFVRITLLWAFTNLLNAAGAILLLLSVPLPVYVLARSGMSWTLMGGAVVLSALLFKRSIGFAALMGGPETLVGGGES